MSKFLIIFLFIFLVITEVSLFSQTIQINKVINDQKYLDNPNISFIGNIEKLELNRQATRVTAPKAEFNIPSKHFPEAYSWESGDSKTTSWYPQGITGNNKYTPDNYILVSWYGKGDGYDYKGVRISFIDLANLKYRHVLLVQDIANLKTQNNEYTQGANFAPVHVHAGGITWLGNYLYVADTHCGIRVFDLTKIFKLNTSNSNKTKCGIINNIPYGFGYKYALPQVAHYDITYEGGASYNPFSCISLSKTEDGALCFSTGQYIKKNKGKPFVTEFTISSEQLNQIPDLIHSSIIEPKDNRESDNSVYYNQGVFINGKYCWMTITGQSEYKNSTARLITWEFGNNKGKRWRWPHGAEDLYYSAKTGKLWCLTEHPDKIRYFFNVSLDTYNSFE